MCDDTYDLLTANAVCRTLGYGTANEASFAAKYGQGTQLVSFNLNFQIDGDEIWVKNILKAELVYARTKLHTTFQLLQEIYMIYVHIVF